MQKISPFLWYDKEAGEAAKFYTSVFQNSKIKSSTKLTDTPSGTVEIVSVNLLGYDLTLMSAGPLFKFTPATSFLVVCDSAEKVDAIWERLSPGGTTMMPIGEYPFSKRYGWTQDRFGLSWQVILMSDPAFRQSIVPTLMFVGNNTGKAENAIKFYTSVFKNSSIGHLARYTKEELPEQEGNIKFGSFIIEDQPFAAMDSSRAHNFNFNESISHEVHCENQDEIDYFWKKLSSDPKSEQCGWLKDQYGVSWQIVPTILASMLQDKDRQKVARVTQAFLKMNKFDIAQLHRAYEG